jgi:hypothetical protein
MHVQPVSADQKSAHLKGLIAKCNALLPLCDVPSGAAARCLRRAFVDNRKGAYGPSARVNSPLNGINMDSSGDSRINLTGAIHSEGAA